MSPLKFEAGQIKAILANLKTANINCLENRSFAVHAVKIPVLGSLGSESFFSSAPKKSPIITELSNALLK